MIKAFTNASTKIEEALFYLDLMDRIEQSRKALTRSRCVESEFSFLLSAFLNACYSCTEYLKRGESNKARIRQFRRTHGEIYDPGQTGGWRTRAVHFYPVIPGHDGYIPPPGDNVILRFREKTHLEQTEASINPDFSQGYFYFSSDSPQNSICDLCAQHVKALKKLAEEFSSP